jgi:hypothetical protein
MPRALCLLVRNVPCVVAEIDGRRTLFVERREFPCGTYRVGEMPTSNDLESDIINTARGIHHPLLTNELKRLTDAQEHQR